jgi:hypothetical protein
MFLLLGLPARAQDVSSACRASAARASGPQGVSSEPIVANPSETPCTTQAQRLAGVQPAGEMSVTDPEASTENAAETLTASASDDSAQFVGPTLVSVGHVRVTQMQRCIGGANVASGSSSVDGLTIAGTPVSVIGSQSIDRTVDGVGIQTNQLDGDTRRALVLDIGDAEYVLGEASASGDACATAPAGAGAGAGEGAGSGGATAGGGGGATAGSGVLAARLAASQLALQCPRRKLMLIDVLQRGGRVALLGAAEKSLIGRKVTITLLASHKRVASAVVEPDGFFATTAALPARGVRFTNAASYQASIGSQRSPYLKLTRRMLVDSISSGSGRVLIDGQVIRPLARPVATIVIERRVSCSASVPVARVKPDSDGAFTVTVSAPARTQAAVYLATTRVRQSRRSRKTYPSWTLPQVVVIQ